MTAAGGGDEILQNRRRANHDISQSRGSASKISKMRLPKSTGLQTTTFKNFAQRKSSLRGVKRFLWLPDLEVGSYLLKGSLPPSWA